MVSTVTDWIDVPYTEAEVGKGQYGMTIELSMAIRAALDIVAPSITWSDFDADNDGMIDAIAIMHSGYGAEAGEADCYTGLGPGDRIWSHKWNLRDPSSWTAPGTGISVSKYHISPALWGSCGSNIGRIGVICHETGHFLGAPDIYDGTGGHGVGSWGMMGNSWGFNGDQVRSTQLIIQIYLFIFPFSAFFVTHNPHKPLADALLHILRSFISTTRR
jgi:M6 family metalloprotease-like protein